MVGGALTFRSGNDLVSEAPRTGDGLRSLVSPNLMIFVSSIFSGGRLNMVACGGVCRDNFRPLAGLAGTGGGGTEGGGPTGKVF